MSKSETRNIMETFDFKKKEIIVKNKNYILCLHIKNKYFILTQRKIGVTSGKLLLSARCKRKSKNYYEINKESLL